jgi:hypothetical protein
MRAASIRALCAKPVFLENGFIASRKRMTSIKLYQSNGESPQRSTPNSPTPIFVEHGRKQLCAEIFDTIGRAVRLQTFANQERAGDLFQILLEIAPDSDVLGVSISHRLRHPTKTGMSTRRLA